MSKQHLEHCLRAYLPCLDELTVFVHTSTPVAIIVFEESDDILLLTISGAPSLHKLWVSDIVVVHII